MLLSIYSYSWCWGVKLEFSSCLSGSGCISSLNLGIGLDSIMYPLLALSILCSLIISSSLSCLKKKISVCMISFSIYSVFVSPWSSKLSYPLTIWSPFQYLMGILKLTGWKQDLIVLLKPDLSSSLSHLSKYPTFFPTAEANTVRTVLEIL